MRVNLVHDRFVTVLNQIGGFKVNQIFQPTMWELNPDLARMGIRFVYARPRFSFLKRNTYLKI
jgi:hypothetical protein